MESENYRVNGAVTFYVYANEAYRQLDIQVSTNPDTDLAIKSALITHKDELGNKWLKIMTSNGPREGTVDDILKAINKEGK